MTVILTESHFFEHLVGEEVKKMLRQTCFDVQDGEPLIILGSSLSFQDKWISHLTRLQTVTVKVVTSWRQMLEQTMKTHAVETLVRLKFTTFSFLSRYFLKSWTYFFLYFPQINSCVNRRSTRNWRWGWRPHCGRNIEWRGYRLRQVWKYELSANQQRYLDEDVQLYSLGWGYYWEGASSR